MAPSRRVAHAGVALAGLVLVSTLTILFQGNNAPLVGQQPEVRHAPGVASAGNAVRQTTARAVNVAVMNK